MDKKIIIIDLDGTFVSVNTFHKWMKFLWREELKKFHFLSLFKILKIIILRLTKSINHKQMKFSILKISEKRITTTQVDSFVDTLDVYISPTVLHTLQKKNTITILATAAPLLYAQKIKEKYHFDYVIATRSTTQTPWEENVRDAKKKNVLSLLKKHSLEKLKLTLYTDHYDDLPLIRYVNDVYMINPSDITLTRLNKENIHFIHL